MAKRQDNFLEKVKNAAKLNPVGLLDFVETVLTDFGRDVNTNRSLLAVMDGLKPSYRRTFVTALKNGSKFMKTASISGTCIASLHPHGDGSINSVISALCRCGIFDGAGNHGANFIRSSSLTVAPSAARYTEARVNEKWRNIISPLMGYVPWVEAEMEGFSEPEYLPTPVPLGLTFGAEGLGYGANCRIPAFTAKSMYEALIHDDPTYLKVPFGLKLNPNQDGLKDLWNTGIGRITYAFKATKENGGFFLKGDAELFSANVRGMKNLEQWCEEGLIRIVDETDEEGSRLFFERTPGVKKIDDDDIQREVLKAAEYTKVYRLTVCKQGRAFVIPLKEWLKECYENYLRLVDLYKQDNINKINFGIEVYTCIPEVAKFLMKNPDVTDDKVIADKLKMKIEVIKAIMQKTISALKRVNTSAKIAELQEDLDHFKKLDPVDYTEDVISKFE